MELGPLFPYTPPASPAPSSEERIRDAALRSFASQGVAATSMRMVADAAGVSLGLVQHYFKTKAALVNTVDHHVLRVISEALGAAAMPDAPAEALEEAGKRMTKLTTDHPLVINYLARALCEGGEIGSVVFDGLVGISTAQRDHFREQGSLREDLDPLWAVLNPLILRVGAFILRPHIERHLGEPFFTATQLERWDDSVTKALRKGQFREL
ncbi:TetR/AcrR family transcriptional regulator [Mycobacterium sp. CVI_P3]|uniref:TetR/AcrR family transcriptional regulator n=1 Tax=Mycobacterium pinniadriaticum TaxID=2994102 RepID=A0ABT3SJ38_9MYCO|nr:TetR/AcrR family transcriptional regulator [Mycobacterium pinniadriaticum]MCX2932777.1 TetR/AcrR family transcriptional regulator [Mycobacterium pinniadriaticum]MCX2939163.1 TetR/AcrR family transcriptional regulator [Mycobacterium pinniadriaticum]